MNNVQEQATATVDDAQARLLIEPFSALIGAEITDIGPDSCTLRIPIRDELKQRRGFVHGGVIAYAADNALATAAFFAMGIPVVTSDLKVSYLRPAIGQYIEARAICIHSGRSQAVSRCDIFVINDETRKLCAVAQGTMMPLARPKSGSPEAKL